MTSSFALQAAQRGWHVFPIRPGGKKPFRNFSWDALASNEPARVRAWAEEYPGCNWAVACGKSGLLVLDVDDRVDKSGSSTLLALELDNEDLPATFTVKTPSGGRHYYFSGTARTTAGALGPGLDTRGAKGYALIPGSATVAPYQILTDAPIAPLPTWLAALVGQAPKDRQAETAPAVELDQDGHVVDAVLYLQNAAPPAIEGQAGDARTIKVAARLKDMGVSEQTALRLMLQIYNPRCVPPWSSEDLRTKVRNAFTYLNENAPGSATAEAAFGELPTEFVTPAEEPNGFDLDRLRASRFLTSSPPAVKWLLKDVMPQGALCFMAGPGGVGKSFFGLQLAVAVAQPGLRSLDGVFEVAPGEHGPVFVLAAEDAEHVLHNRARDIHQEFMPFDESEGEIARLGDLYVLDAVGRDVRLATEEGKPTKFFGKLLCTLKRIVGLKLVVLDNLARLFAGNENDNSAAAAFCAVVERIITETGSGVLVLHHTAKGSSRGKDRQDYLDRLTMDSMRGAGAFVNSSRWVLMLTGLQEGEVKAIGGDVSAPWRYLAGKVAKNNYAPCGPAFFMARQETGVLRRIIARPKKAPSDELREWLAERIIEAVTSGAEAGKPCTVDALKRFHQPGWKAEQREATKPAVEIIAAELIRDGRIVEREKPNSRGKATRYLAPCNSCKTTPEKTPADTAETSAEHRRNTAGDLPPNAAEIESAV